MNESSEGVFSFPSADVFKHIMGFAHCKPSQVGLSDARPSQAKRVLFHIGAEPSLNQFAGF